MPARGGTLAATGKTIERLVSTYPPKYHLEEMVAVKEQVMKPKVVTPIEVASLPLMAIEVIQ